MQNISFLLNADLPVTLSNWRRGWNLLSFIKKSTSSSQANWPTLGEHPGFHSMKRLEVLPFPPGYNASPSQVRPQYFDHFVRSGSAFSLLSYQWSIQSSSPYPSAEHISRHHRCNFNNLGTFKKGGIICPLPLPTILQPKDQQEPGLNNKDLEAYATIKTNK